MNTLEARYGIDNALTAWVRKDDVKQDFTGDTLTIAVFAYGSTIPVTTLSATSPAAGKVTFNVTQQDTERALGPALYRLSLRANSEECWSGLLRIV